MIERGRSGAACAPSRKEFEQLLDDVLARGRTRTAAFRRPPPRAARRCSAWSTTPPQWFRPRGRLTPEQIADGYVDLLLGLAASLAVVTRPVGDGAQEVGDRPDEHAAGLLLPAALERARCSSITCSIRSWSDERIAASVRSWMSMTQSGIGGSCTAMSRAISRRRSRLRISETIVVLPVARAMRRWNWVSS